MYIHGMRTRTSIALTLALCTLATAALAGPLTPPGGLVTQTGKPIGEIEPRVPVNAANISGDAASEFIISAPGSYYLTGNITSSKTNAISITGANVTLDLNGFTVANTSASGSASAIAVSGTNLTLRGGTLVATGRAVNATAADLVMVIDDIRARTGRGGIVSFGPATITRCIVTQNADSATTAYQGIVVSGRSLVRECTVVLLTTSTTPSGNEAIYAAGNSIVDSCVIYGGGVGVSTPDGIVRNCRLQDQNNIGIRLSSGGICENNSITGSQPIGIACSNAEVRGNRINGTVTANAIGIYLIGPNNTVAKNTIANVAGTNGYGIATFASTNVGGNKIMENELINNWRHINITAPYNLIVRNSMSFVGAGGNVNFATGNAFGPVINAGNADLSTVAGSAHPQANIAY